MSQTSKQTPLPKQTLRYWRRSNYLLSGGHQKGVQTENKAKQNIRFTQNSEFHLIDLSEHVYFDGIVLESWYFILYCNVTIFKIIIYFMKMNAFFFFFYHSFI